METIGKKVVGFYICWGCHQQFQFYEGQRRRYCPDCALERMKEMAGTRRGKSDDHKD